MKDFFKTIGVGLLVLFISVLSITLIAASCYRLFVELPTATGITAVGMFAISLMWLAIGGLFIYALGYGVLKNNGG